MHSMYVNYIASCVYRHFVDWQYFIQGLVDVYVLGSVWTFEQEVSCCSQERRPWGGKGPVSSEWVGEMSSEAVDDCRPDAGTGQCRWETHTAQTKGWCIRMWQTTVLVMMIWWSWLCCYYHQFTDQRDCENNVVGHFTDFELYLRLGTWC